MPGWVDEWVGGWMDHLFKSHSIGATLHLNQANADLFLLDIIIVTYGSVENVCLKSLYVRSLFWGLVHCLTLKSVFTSFTHCI